MTRAETAAIKQLEREAGVTAAQTLMVGDSSVDIQTAVNAGRDADVQGGRQGQAALDKKVSAAPRVTSVC